MTSNPELKVARIRGMRLPLPPKANGGAQTSLSQMTVFQAATCAHDITLYGPADSTIIEFAGEIAAKLGLKTRKNSSADTIEIYNTDEKIGRIQLRTSGRSAIGYRDPNADLYEQELVDLLIEDDRQQPYDIVHSHAKKLTDSLLTGMLDNHKILTHCHEHKLIYKTYKYPVICISHRQAAVFRQQGIFVYDVMHNGLDPFTHHYVEEHADYLVWVGRFTEVKGPLQAIKIAKKARKILILAGPTHSYRAPSLFFFNTTIKPLIDVEDRELLNRMGSLSVTEIKQELATICKYTESPIIFVGVVNDLEKQILYGRAEATLFPIKWHEPFGRVMIESMACGTPVIGYAKVGPIFCGAVKEVIEDGVTGFHIHAKNDEEAINKAVSALTRITVINRKQVRGVFDRDWTSERLAKQIDAAYRRRLAEPKKPLEICKSGSPNWLIGFTNMFRKYRILQILLVWLGRNRQQVDRDSEPT